MTQEVINIGTAPNDGLGDPLRTAFAKTNNNFSQLFSIAGVSSIANGSSNVNIPQANGNVIISSAGAANVVVVTGSGVNVAGTLNSTGLATLSNLSVTGTIVSTGTIQSIADVTAVAITASGNLSANNAVITGNVTGGLFTGNGAGLTGVIATGNVGAATQLTNGTTTMNIPVANGNIIGNVGGVLNIFTLSTSGLTLAGIASVSGNVTGGNILTAGLVSATANVTGGNILTAGQVSATANVTGGNILTGGLISATANITGANLLGLVLSVSGNVTGGSFITGGVITATANVTGGNLLTGGLVSATGTITSSANIVSGNILTGGLISATGNITGGNISLNNTSGNIVAYDALLGGVVSAAGNVRGGNINTVGVVTATANIIGGNILTGGLISATGGITSAANITASNLSVGTGTITVGNIVNSNGNAIGNIGSSTTYFNQVFAQATTALYADLAEVYSADANYTPGTVVSFGGEQEVTKTIVASDPRVAGVISTNPSYLMNSGLTAEYCADVALSGRVPTLVVGPVVKGDMMVSAGNGRAQACVAPAMGTVIGKALENFSGELGTIEIVVGRL